MQHKSATKKSPQIATLNVGENGLEFIYIVFFIAALSTISFFVDKYLLKHGNFKLRNHWLVLSFGLLAVCISVAALIYDFENEKYVFFTGRSDTTKSLFMLFMGITLIVIYIREIGTYDDRGISMRGILGVKKEETWDHLLEVKFNSSRRSYILHFLSGNRIGISLMLLGRTELLEQLKVKGHKF